MKLPEVADTQTYTQRRIGRDFFARQAQALTFRQEVTDPLATVKTRDVKKTLYPSEEGR